MPSLTVDNAQVMYEDYGAGPLVMLVHGSPATASAWQPVGRRLADRFRVVAPNLPGYAGTSPEDPDTPPSVSHAAALLEALIRETGTPRVLAGHSYGGAVALAVALRGHVKPGALALLEPVCIPILLTTGDTGGFAAAKAIFDEYLRAWEGGDRLAARTMIEFWFGLGAFERLPAPVRDFLLQHTEPNVHDVRASFGERYSAEALRGLRVPVEVMYGTKSPDVSHRVASALVALAPDCSALTVEGATHALTTTHSERVAGAIAALAARASDGDQPEKV